LLGPLGGPCSAAQGCDAPKTRSSQREDQNPLRNKTVALKREREYSKAEEYSQPAFSIFNRTTDELEEGRPVNDTQASHAAHGAGHELETGKAYEPKVVAYCCTYCAYTAADLAGSMRLSYSPQVRIIKTLCTGKIDALLLLKAFEEGADAVFVAGCNIGDCHFLEGNLRAIQVVAHAKHLLAEIGLEPERLEFFHIPASAGPLFAQRANQMVERAMALGPNPLRFSAHEKYGKKLQREPDSHPALPPARFGRLVTEAEREKGATPVRTPEGTIPGA